MNNARNTSNCLHSISQKERKEREKRIREQRANSQKAYEEQKKREASEKFQPRTRNAASIEFIELVRRTEQGL